MCVMKGSDDGRVLLDLDLLAFLCFHVSELVVWPVNLLGEFSVLCFCFNLVCMFISW